MKSKRKPRKQKKGKGAGAGNEEWEHEADQYHREDNVVLTPKVAPKKYQGKGAKLDNYEDVWTQSGGDSEPAQEFEWEHDSEDSHGEYKSRVIDPNYFQKPFEHKTKIDEPMLFKFPDYKEGK